MIIHKMYTDINTFFKYYNFRCILIVAPESVSTKYPNTINYENCVGSIQVPISYSFAES